MADSIDVPFAGDGSGVEELTWAQFAAWRSMQVVEATEWAGGTMRLPQGTTVDFVATSIGFYLSRHQSLRTRLLADGDNPPKQLLAASGSLTLEVYEADGDPERQAAEIRARYEAAPWDPFTDWPVRMAVVAQDGIALHFVALYCHMVIDGYGFEALLADLDNLDPVTGEHLAPVAGVQPFELARSQRGSSALRQHASSLRYWEKHLRTIAPKRFAQPRPPQAERWWEATFTSPATHLALSAVNDRLKVHTGTILLAAYAVMLGRLSRQPVGAFRIVVSNRFRPGFAESVSNLAQAGLAIIDTAVGDGEGFDEIVARTWKSQLTAGMYAYYHPRDLWSLIERVSGERGVEIDTLCYFNDRRRSAGQGVAERIPGRAEITAALPLSTLRWGPSSNEFDATCFLHVDAAADAVELTWRVDTAAVSPAMLEDCLRGIESLVVGAAIGAGARPTESALLTAHS